MDDAEKERKRKALQAMMGGEQVKYIGSEFEEKKPEPPPVRCNGCGGSGKCQACEGSGAEECPTCDGSGRVGGNYSKVTQGSDRTYVYQASGFGGTCPDCGGSGKKMQFWPMTKAAPCKYCGGSGKCGACSGKGIVKAR